MKKTIDSLLEKLHDVIQQRNQAVELALRFRAKCDPFDFRSGLKADFERLNRLVSDITQSENGK